MTDRNSKLLRALANSIALMMLVGLAACSSTEEVVEEPVPTGSEFRQGAVEPEPEPVAAPVSVPMKLDTVYFDFDRAAIREDAKPVLRSNADSILAGQGTVTIEGHCDERGSEEYNLALGERRANSVKKYLVNLGVEGSRLRTLSYGEAKPAVEGHNESAWRWNRRSGFRSGS